MKKAHLIAIAAIAVGIFVLLSISGDVGTYSTFSDAKSHGKKVKIAGQLSKDKEIYYNPEEDPNLFTFFMTDTKGEERKVLFLDKRPQDFELSEQIVLTGKMTGDDFIATEMLMKCPSKYKDEEIYIKSQQG